ncbi:hypothetical protein [Flavimarina sp. Hel_I_48]|uniref:hypothetical protein n=1 Tax=Flavimarina sp. Hel_I_48 TaxID=1392488 RepID=UPI0004DF45A5|nr:hypothetical protein [Flavimarina sp. Hel_I_48]
MRIKSHLLAFALLGGLHLATAQETPETEQKPNTINQQFEDMKESSNNFQEYKVVKRTTLDRLQSNTQDSLNAFKVQVSTFDDQLEERNNNIASLKSSLKETKNTLEETRANVASISFLGIQMSKAGYKTLMWAIVGILALALVFFIIRYRGSNAHTIAARKKLGEVEYEYDDFRKKSLEKEQRLGRQLQDERNKGIKKP